MVSVNFGDMLKAAGDAPGFTVIPAGDYDVVVDTAANKTTSSGKESIAAQFKVENGPHAGASLFWQAVLSPENPNALAFWFRHMAALGLTEEYFQSNPPLERVAADLIGRRCRVAVGIRQWEKQDRNEVKSVMPSDGNGPPPPPAATATPGLPSVTPSAKATSSAPAVPAVPSVPAVPATSAYEQATGTAPSVTPTSVTPPPPADDDLPF
jgi:hypothetical protein